MSDNSLSQTLHFTAMALIAALMLLSAGLYFTGSFALFTEIQTLTMLVISVFLAILYGLARKSLPRNIMILRSMVRKKAEREFSILSRDLGGNIEEEIASYTKRYWTEQLLFALIGTTGIALRMLFSQWYFTIPGWILIFITLLFFYRNLMENPEDKLQVDTRVSATGTQK